ncbi:MAG: phosphoribosylglycinamide formyltransferase [Planctomycetota bacterium]|nr:phosphoribosylglycinamide formyltransferase [Planctomycetota bacterium]RLS25923.1 MAG: phosphoribosylglycinamide formyltransferase [Planctomycetota bacterium]
MPDSSIAYVPRQLPAKDGPIRLAVCISGGGTTLANLLEKIDQGLLTGFEISIVISDRSDAKGLEIATSRGIPTAVVNRMDLQMSALIFQKIRSVKADMVVLGGFLSLLFVPDDYQHRVLNIHPSLIPAFCGRGYFGKAVHKAAIDAGVKFSGCTVHFADRSYDTGPIIIQKVVDVLDDDTPDSLAKRVFQAECEALPEAIRIVASGNLEQHGRRMVIKPS